MHDTALSFGKLFFDQYVVGRTGVRVVDIGSQDVNGSLRSVCPPGVEYIGVDFQDAKGVDVIMTDPYSIPLETGSADVCVSSSCFEHSEFFWLLFLEVMRVLKSGGLFFLNAPSNGVFHQYPVDCWRFYPDSGLALQNWGRRSGIDCALLESFVGAQQLNGWNDFIAVIVKGDGDVEAHRHRNRMLHTSPPCTNGRIYGSPDIINFTPHQEDQVKSVFARAHRSIAKRLRKTIDRL